MTERQAAYAVSFFVCDGPPVLFFCSRGFGCKWQVDLAASYVSSEFDADNDDRAMSLQALHVFRRWM